MPTEPNHAAYAPYDPRFDFPVRERGWQDKPAPAPRRIRLPKRQVR